MKHVESELDAALDTMKIAAEICILTIRNGFGRDNLYIYDPEGGGVDPVTGEPLIFLVNPSKRVDVQTYERNAVADRFIDAANH